MRKLFLIIFILIQFPLLSQSLDGKFQLGGSLSFYSNTSKNEYGSGLYFQERNSKYTSFSILPQFGYFLNELISVGGQIGYTRNVDYFYSENSQGDVNESTRYDNILNLGTFTRFHKPINETLFLFIQGNVNFGLGTSTYENPNNDQDRFDFQAGLQPGILYMVSEKFGIEGTMGFLGYNLSKRNGENGSEQSTDERNSFIFQFNPSTFNLGLQFYL